MRNTLAIAAIFCSAFLACSDNATGTADAGSPTDSASPPSSAPAAPKAGEVLVNVSYSGKKVGPSLSVALFTEFPPKGPPAGVGRVESPKSFPQTLRVPNVAAGTYVAVVRLTAQGNDPQSQAAQAGDLQGASKPFTLTAQDGVTTTVELVDP